MEFETENWQTNIEVYACLFQTFSVFRLCRNYQISEKKTVSSVNLPALQHGLLPSTSRRAVREECHENSEGPTVRGENDTQCVTTVDEQPTVDDIQAAEALISLLGEQNNLEL
ncbi:hypothetical protein JTB14_034030 [Gonioctena quinquepunctata]|nr:hypothetical protein JTB14_034030 [Gonioctena quinquepunctata]